MAPMRCTICPYMCRWVIRAFNQGHHRVPTQIQSLLIVTYIERFVLSQVKVVQLLSEMVEFSGEGVHHNVVAS